MTSYRLEDDYEIVDLAASSIFVGEATDWYIQQTIDVATESSNGGDVDVKRMKLDADTAAVSADDVTGRNVADAASYSCVSQHADQLRFRLAAKHEPELDDSTSQTTDTDEEEFVVTVRYCGTEVLNRTVSNRTGCRLCYDQLHITERLDDFLPNEFRQTLFGPRQAEAIVLPPCENFMNVDVQRTIASKMLTRGLQRGLVIHCINNNIFVYRLCQCAVFFYKQSAVYDVGQPAVKLRRTEASPGDMTCLFNYGTYVAALKDYLDDRAPKPDPHCVLVFGQEKPFCRDDSTILVSVTVATSRALEDLKKAEAAMALRTPSALVSTSNEFDKLARYMHHIELNQLQQQQQSSSNVTGVPYSASDNDEFAEHLKPDDDLL